MLKLIFSLLFLSFAPLIGKSEEMKTFELACAHVQVCNLVDEILTEADADHKVELTMPFQIKGDPHHFGPGPQVVKALLEAPFLITPSRYLSPWTRKILQQRSNKMTTKSFELALESSQSLQEKFSQEVLAHFWLRPESLCQAKKQITKNLIEWGVIKKNHKSRCFKSKVQKLGKKLRLHSQSIPLVLYHDALMPYFSELGIQAFTLKGSGHGERMSVQKLKKFHQYLEQNSRVLWIRESSIHIHSQLKGLQRKDDISIEVDTLGHRQQPSTETLTQVLKGLLSTLTENFEEIK